MGSGVKCPVCLFELGLRDSLVVSVGLNDFPFFNYVMAPCCGSRGDLLWGIN